MPGDEGEPAARIFRGRRSDFLPPKGESSVLRGGEGGIRTLDGGIHPHNALAGRRLQPLGHFSAGARRIAEGLRGVLAAFFFAVCTVYCRTRGPDARRLSA